MQIKQDDSSQQDQNNIFILKNTIAKQKTEISFIHSTSRAMLKIMENTEKADEANLFLQLEKELQ